MHGEHAGRIAGIIKPGDIAFDLCHRIVDRDLQRGAVDPRDHAVTRGELREAGLPEPVDHVL